VRLNRPDGVKLLKFDYISPLRTRRLFSLAAELTAGGFVSAVCMHRGEKAAGLKLNARFGESISSDIGC
jgi:hypothetical protein